MRMNLAEIALSLGCLPEAILWRDGSGNASGAGPDSAPSAFADPLPQPRGGAESGIVFPFEEHYTFLNDVAPWAAIVPTGASMDSRTVKPGNLFFCLAGERVDGHDFALAAAKAGACAIIASRNPFWNLDRDSETGLQLPPVFLVKEPLNALWRLAICHRDTTMARVIGVTGTAGKTSVKEVLAQILSLRGHTERNPMNLNNQIGLPLSMLNASADALFWVMEAGISEARDMDELGRILRPDTALILNVGKAHMVGLGERGVAANKALLLDYIQPGGVAAVSADYPDLQEEVEKRADRFADIGLDLADFSTVSQKAFAWAEYLGSGPDLAGQYRVIVDGQDCIVHTCFRGDFGSENVAAIAAVAVKMGLTTQEIIQGFARATLPNQRFNCRRYNGFTVVDDSYNANPLSSARMIHACRSMAGESGQPLFLVMGEMLELGDIAEEAHEELGQRMAEAAPETVFWKGGHADAVLRGLRRAGYAKGFYPVGGGQDFSLLLEELEPKSGLFLFKGSRRNNLERLVDILRDRVAPAGETDAL